MTLLVPTMSANSPASFSRAEIPPMADMNTTPLIDVMLVLLIMFIITIPPQTDAVKIDVPTGPTPVVKSISNELALTAGGQAMWNGQAIDDRTLRATLERSVAMDPAPELHFRPDAATNYGRVDVHAVIGAGRLAVDEDAKAHRLARSAAEHEVEVASLEAEGNLPVRLRQQRPLWLDRPASAQGPFVELE